MPSWIKNGQTESRPCWTISRLPLLTDAEPGRAVRCLNDQEGDLLAVDQDFRDGLPAVAVVILSGIAGVDKNDALVAVGEPPPVVHVGVSGKDGLDLVLMLDQQTPEGIFFRIERQVGFVEGNEDMANVVGRIEGRFEPNQHRLPVKGFAEAGILVQHDQPHVLPVRMVVEAPLVLKPYFFPIQRHDLLEEEADVTLTLVISSHGKIGRDGAENLPEDAEIFFRRAQIATGQDKIKRRILLVRVDGLSPDLVQNVPVGRETRAIIAEDGKGPLVGQGGTGNEEQQEDSDQ